MDIYSNFDEKKNFFNGNYIITDIKILKTKLDELSGPGLFLEALIMQAIKYIVAFNVNFVQSKIIIRILLYQSILTKYLMLSIRAKS